MAENKTQTVWTSENGKDFYPSRPAFTSIPKGAYLLKYSTEYGAYVSKLDFKTDNAIPVLNSYYKDISADFENFLSLKNKYKSSGIEFNRAILIHGQPGCGKKYLCRRLAESFDGITLYVEDPTDLNQFISSIQNANSSSNILVVMEEVGISLEKYGLSAIKNVLKSNENRDGVYVVATTNFESKISEFLTDKPGMFEEKFFIEYPDEVERGQYIKSLYEILDIKCSKNKINKISKETKTLSIGHIKNLIESVELYEYSYADKLDELLEMKDNIMASTYSDNASRNIGFE